ncbi:transposable element Tcb1 transposase [Trichonephila clavipes]|uniref:Transposable element Tcb1 transposase n=1 Tax=Trichonephila clavipes TaxID=2585209 RepID=A0A8X6S8E8_TRICX|nr:transposable element Tcb1 transposase [Trichonephila clavipes]
MTQRKHLDDFLRGRITGRLECGRTQLEVSEELGIAQSVISRLWQRFQDDEQPEQSPGPMEESPRPMGQLIEPMDQFET